MQERPLVSAWVRLLQWTAGGKKMSAPLSPGSPWGCLRQSGFPPEFGSSPPARGGATPDSRLASSSDSFHRSGVGGGARRLWRGLGAGLLSVPLLVIFQTVAQAQVECSNPNPDGSYAVPEDWELIPAGLSPDSRFRLLFVTSTSRRSDSTDIAVYNTFVQNRAKAGHAAISDSCANLFKVVGSTATVNARVNTDTEASDTDAAIYWLKGVKVADDYADFYDGSWDNTDSSGKPYKNENGITDRSEVFREAFVPTGTNNDGATSGNPLGSDPFVTGAELNIMPPFENSGARSDITRTHYGLSPVFTTAGHVITVTADGERVTEGESASFTLRAEPAPSRSIDVMLELSDSGDFARQGRTGMKRVTLGKGTGSLQFTVATQNDGRSEAHGTITAALRPGSYIVGAESEAVVRVSDDDITAGVRPSVTDLRALPEGGRVSFNIELSKTLDGDQTLTLPLSRGGTASWLPSPSQRITQDYRLGCEASPLMTCSNLNNVNPSITFHGAELNKQEISGSSTRKLRSVTEVLWLEAIVDNTAEADETVTLSLGGRREATITLKDPPSSVTLFFAQGLYSVSEDGNVLQPTLQANTEPGQDIVVPLIFTDITATEGEDYEAVATMTFSADGSLRQSFDIPLLDDTVYEGDETFRVEIDASRLPDGVKVGSRSSATFEIQENDPRMQVPVITITPGTSPVTEGVGASFTVNANPAPAANLDVTVAVTQSGDFVASSNRGAKTVTIAANATSKVYTVPTENDMVDEANGSVTVTVNNGQGYTVGSTAAATVTVNDDDIPDITAPRVTSITRQTPSSEVTDADSLTWRVLFNEAVQNVDRGDFQVDGATATLAVAQVGATNAYDVTASGGDLAGLVSTTVTLSFTSGQNIQDTSGNMLTNTTPTGTNHNTFVVRNYTVSPLEIYEGERLTFTIAGFQSNYNLGVRINTSTSTATRNSDYNLYAVGGQTNVVYHAIPQGSTRQFDIEAVADSDGSEGDETIVVEFGQDGGGYLTGGTVLHTDTVTLKDGARPNMSNDGVTISPTSLALTELGAANLVEKTYTVVLNTDPTADVTVTVANGDSTAVEVDTDSGTDGSQNTLTFTHGNSGNWATAQTVTVRALNDGDGANESFNLTHTATATGSTAPYDGITIDPVAITTTDVGHGVVISESSLSVAENDETATYTVALKSQPGGDVEIATTSGATGTATASPATLTFGSSTWNTPQTVTVTGKGSGSTSISHAVATSADTTNYPTSTTIPSVAVTVTAAQTVTATPAGVCEGQTTEVTVSNVSATPGSVVSVSLTGLHNSQVYFVNSDGTDAGQIDFPVSVVNDAFTVSIRVAENIVTSSNEIGGGIEDPNNYWDGVQLQIWDSADSRCAVTVTDGVTISPTSLALTELGASSAMEKTYTVVLDTDPTANVTVTVANGDNTAVAVDTDSGTNGDQSTLTFTAGGDGSGSGAGNGNWATAQTVTVRALNDADALAESFNLTHSATATGSTAPYHNITIDPVAITTTDAGHGVVVSESTLSVAENDETATYTVVLKSQPGGNVEITTTSGATGTATVSPTSLSFTNSDWNTPKTFTVTGMGAGSTSISHGVTTGTTDYPISTTIPPVAVTVTATQDTTAPRVTSIRRQTPSSSPTDADSLIWRVTFNEAVRNVNAADFQVSGATAVLAVAQVGATNAYDVTASGGNLANLDATVTVSFANSQNIQDTSGNSLSNTTPTGDNDNTFVVDNTNPDTTAPLVDSITRQTPSSSPTDADSLIWRVTFNEAVQNVDRADFSLTGTTATLAVAQVGATNAYDVTASGGNLANLDATVTLSFASGQDIQDTAGNPLATTTPTGANDNNFVVDNTSPPPPPAPPAPPASSDVPVVSITAGKTVSEGIPATFTLTATPPPAPGNPIVVNLMLSASGEVISSGETGSRSFTIYDSTTTVTVSTEDDAVQEEDGSVTATVQDGTGYAIHPSDSSASVTVRDNELAELSVPSLTVAAGESASYAVTLADQPMGEVTVTIAVTPEQVISLGRSASNTVENAMGLVVTPDRLLFTPSNWDDPQEVVVRVTEDAHGASLVLRHIVRGDGLDGRGDTHLPVTVDAATETVDTATETVDASTDAAEGMEAWRLRFGRTLSHQVVDALQDRFAAPTTTGLELTVAGEAVSSPPALVENQGLLSKALGFENLTGEELVEGSSFSFAPQEEAGAPQLALWGQGAFSSFSGQEEEVSLDGDVTTLLLGADWSTGRWQAGAALSRSWGSGSYDGNDDADGEISTTLTGLFPYGRYALSPRLGLWATAGYGWGDLSLNPDGNGEEYEPDTTMTMVALGMDGLLLDGGSEGVSLNTTADLLSLNTSSEEVEGLESSEGNLSRLRLGLEATRPFPFANGSSLLPSLEMGIRQDGGDAETGFGLDLGAGIAWKDPQRGISAELKGRTLLSHAEEEFQDQGLALSFSWDPSPSNRGPYLSMGHAMGATATADMDALFNPATFEQTDGNPSNGQQFAAELAYGFPVHNDRLTLTPAVAMALSPTSRNYGLLWSLAPYAEQRETDPWQFSIEAERQEQNTATSPVEHSLKLRFSLPYR